MTERIFDRIPSPASRSAEFPMRRALDTMTVRSYTWRYVQLDQGQEGDCVAFDSTMEAAARPKPFFGDPVTDPPDVNELNRYAHEVVMERCRFHDGYQFPEGATQLAGMKAGVDANYWGGYLWATGTPHDKAMQVLAAIRKAPVCMASDWHPGMSWPDNPGILQPTGTPLGGHSYLLSAVSARRMAAWTPNSWGGYGQGWLDLAALTFLFESGGEAAMPVERRLSGTT